LFRGAQLALSVRCSAPSIIKYSTESPQDFKKLQKQITARIKALLQKKTQLSQVSQMSSVAKLEGLEQWEIAALVAVAQQINDPNDGISAYRVREDMERTGFTKLAATLGLRALLDKKMLETFEDDDYDGSKYTAYRVTDRGMNWLFANQNKLTLRQEQADDFPTVNDDDFRSR
jgi:hypothetical protein